MMNPRPSLLHRLHALVVSPSSLKRQLLLRSKRAPFELKLAYDAVTHPWYAYGLHLAALQAKALKIPAISALEFGVAGAVGLRALEQHAETIEGLTGVKIEVYGFDTNTGMPPPVDHRDCGFLWGPGNFAPAIDVRKTLKRAKFVIGDVSETAARFQAQFNPAPIGFAAIDVDYYSSTMSAFRVFDLPPGYLLPRVMCYLDDITGDDHELITEHVGELLAVKDFNEMHPMRKIGKINNLAWKRKIPQVWNEHMFVLNVFDHARYNTQIHPRWARLSRQEKKRREGAGVVKA